MSSSINTSTMNTPVKTVEVKHPKAKTAPPKKRNPERVEFGRNVTVWRYCYVTRDDLPDRINHPDGNDAAFKGDEEAESDWYDRVWDALVARANHCDGIDLGSVDGDCDEMDGEDDDEIEEKLDECVDEVVEEDKEVAAEKARAEAEAAAAVEVPVVPEKTREELLAEIARLTAELDAIKARMRKAMEDLGY
jgi:hypothetical protein